MGALIPRIWTSGDDCLESQSAANPLPACTGLLRFTSDVTHAESFLIHVLFDEPMDLETRPPTGSVGRFNTYGCIPEIIIKIVIKQSGIIDYQC